GIELYSVDEVRRCARAKQSCRIAKSAVKAIAVIASCEKSRETHGAVDLIPMQKLRIAGFRSRARIGEKFDNLILESAIRRRVMGNVDPAALGQVLILAPLWHLISSLQHSPRQRQLVCDPCCLRVVTRLRLARIHRRSRHANVAHAPPPSRRRQESRRLA